MQHKDRTIIFAVYGKRQKVPNESFMIFFHANSGHFFFSNKKYYFYQYKINSMKNQLKNQNNILE